MKKAIIAIATMLTSGFAFAAWQVEFSAGQFYFDEDTPVQEALNFAVVVDMEGNGFDDFELFDGDSFARGSYINSDNEYMTLATSKLMDADGEGYYLAYSNDTWNFTNDEYGFTGNEEAAVIVWDSASGDTYTLSTGDKYTIATPSLAGGELSEGDTWTIPAGDIGKWYWQLYCVGIEGNVPNALVTLSQTVQAVPEPSTFAAVFGAAALALALIRRRK